MLNNDHAAALRIKTEPSQMEDVIRQVGKVFFLTPLIDETAPNERHFGVQPRPAPTSFPPINVTYWAAGDDGPITPDKMRSLFCNPIYAGIPPYCQAISDDYEWIRAAAKFARMESVESLLVNLLYTLQTSLGVDGADRRQDDVSLNNPPHDFSLEHPIALRLQCERDILPQLKKQLGLIFVLSENKGPGTSTAKHFGARLTGKTSLPKITAKYLHIEKILAEPPTFTDKFMSVATDINNHWNFFANPMYTGVADFPRIARDILWLKGAAQMMREYGIEQYLVNMLYLMRRSSHDFAESSDHPHQL